MEKLTKAEKLALRLVDHDTWICMRFAASFSVIGVIFVALSILNGKGTIAGGLFIIVVFLTMALILFVESIDCRLRPELYRE